MDEWETAFIEAESKSEHHSALLMRVEELQVKATETFDERLLKLHG